MKILLVAYYFPPYGGGPTVRIHNFVKYLPGTGIFPVVITACAELYERTYLNQELLSDYASEVKVFRTGAFFGKSLARMKNNAINQPGKPARSVTRTIKKQLKSVAIPDDQIMWALRAFPSALRHAKAQGVEAVFATAPPFSSLLLAQMVAHRLRKPLILDYRDLWRGNPGTSQSKISKLMEKKIVAKASLIIVTNECARRMMQELYDISDDRIVTIPNGYDDAAIRLAQGRPQAQGTNFYVDYLGSLTNHRTPEFLLRAFKQALQEDPQQQNVKLRFFGFSPPLYKDFVRSMELDDHVEFHEPVSSRRALEIMCQESNLLLVLQRSAEGADTAIPGKVYEYLASGKPVLAMDEPGGATTQLLSSLGCTTTANYTDVDAISEQLLKTMNTYQALQDEALMLREKVRRFERKTQATELARLIKNCAILDQRCT